MARDLTSRLKAAAHAVALVRERLAALGPVRVEGDQMYAGETLLNRDETLVDSIYDDTLFGCTIFLGPTRIATRATARGSKARALGTNASDEIIALVLERGETFVGSTETLGRTWAIVYEPLEDAAGKRIGMLACYREIISR